MSSGSINASVDIADGGQFTFASNNPVYTSAFQGRLIITHVAGGRGATTDLSEFADFDYVIDVGSADFGPGISSYTAEFQLSSVSKGTIWLLSEGLGLLIATRVYRRRFKSAT